MHAATPSSCAGRVDDRLVSMSACRRATLLVALALLAGMAGCTSPSSLSSVKAPTPTATSAQRNFVARTTVLSGHLLGAVYRTAAAAENGAIYLLGGIDAAGATIAAVERVDPATGKARSAGSLALPTHGAAGLTVGSRVLIFGGASPPTVHDVVQGYDPVTGTSRIVARLPGPRADQAAAAVGDNVLLLGGFDGYRPLGSILVGTGGGHFRRIGHLARAVRYPGVVAQAGTVYLFGGLLSGGEYDGLFTTDIQRVDSATGTARVVGHLPVPLAHVKATILDGQILLLGGSTPSGPSAAILRFMPATDTTSRVGRLPYPDTDGAAVTVGSTAYLLGGISSAPVSHVVAIRLTRAGG
jgi:hypothetical protein